MKKVDFEKISVFDSPKHSPGFLLWHVSTCWRSSIEEVLKTVDLTHPQFVVLAALGWLTKDGELVTQRAVGKMAGLDPNTTSQIIKGLELKELVTRAQSTDARAKNPLLTDKGSKILNQALPLVEKTDAQFFDPLTTKEIKSIVEIFQKLMLE